MIFEVINFGTVSGVALAGLGLGIYFALGCKHGYHMPTLVTLLVIGWSYLLAVGLVQAVLQENVTIGRAFERLFLWFLFSVHAQSAFLVVRFYVENRKRKG